MSDVSLKQIGSEGEATAVGFLKSQGYRIIEQNYRKFRGEIDIIAQDREVLCFIEVKTRLGKGRGLAKEAVTNLKQRQIVRTALAYVQDKKIKNMLMRFDVVAVDFGEDSSGKVELIKGAFDADG